MFPCTSVPDVGDVVLIDAVLPRQDSARYSTPEASYLAHVPLCELHLVVPLILLNPKPMTLTPLLHHVAVVVPDCAEKEVRRAHTGQVVAAMQNAQPRWYSPVGEFPCDAMRAAGPTTDTDASVPEPMARTRPQPALTIGHHTHPELGGEFYIRLSSTTP